MTLGAYFTSFLQSILKKPSFSPIVSNFAKVFSLPFFSLRQKLRSLGVKIAIDDFGTGYSNFERLLEYKPDIIKIDGSLIKNIQTNRHNRSIVEMIVTFAKKQHIQTIAEFVESEEIFHIVQALGIDYSQGYAFGKPELF